MKRRWWNCWLAHSWPQWSAPIQGTINLPTGSKVDTEFQERYCRICLARELRRAR